MKTILLFSDDPMDSFVYNEMVSLKAAGAQIVVMCQKKVDAHVKSQKEPWFRIEDDWRLDEGSFIKIFSKYPILFLSIWLYEFSKRPINVLKNWRLSLAFLAREIKKWEDLKWYLISNKLDKSVVAYSFWFYNTTFLSIAVKSGDLTKFVARAHGHDVYEEHNGGLWLPFRAFNLKWVGEVFAISRHGLNYLSNKFSIVRNKITVQHLGSKDYGMGTMVQLGSPLHIVSCAYVNNKKRLYLIPKILENISTPVHWTHIGSLKEADQIELIKSSYEQTKLRNDKVTMELKGTMTQPEIMEYYRTTPIDMFISVSETEGLPVSMMEAISFGIPLIATDVGGCSEIANNLTGILVPKEFNPKKVANEIVKYISETGRTINCRNKIREFWLINFNTLNNGKVLLAKLNK
jgi:glycosyltransferase involved in cell wall biosynthesis